MRETVEIPLYVAGEPLTGSEQRLELRGWAGEVTLLLPAVTPETLGRVLDGPRDLSGLSLRNILDFLAAVGEIWADRSSPIRREAFELMTRATAFHPKELEVDFGYVPALLSEELFLGPTLRAELPDPGMLDEWRPNGASAVRAFPLGRVLHVLAGNVPGSEMLSLARSLLTRNSSLLKMATGNPVTPSYLLRSFREVDATHPVTLATSVLYWPHGAPAERRAFELSDGVCVWGGFDAVAAAYAHARPGLPILDYGPKRSIAFVDRESVADEGRRRAVARELAHDVAVHEQLACHSPQVAFVESPAGPFCDALGGALAEVGETHPKGYVSIDGNAEIVHARMMAELRGEAVLHPGTNEWTIIRTTDPVHAEETPLSRTLYVVEVDDLDEDAVPRADRYTMVVGFASPTRLAALRDALALRGVDRLTLVGRMGLPPPGFPHEGRYDLTRLLRFVGTDLASGD